VGARVSIGPNLSNISQPEATFDPDRSGEKNSSVGRKRRRAVTAADFHPIDATRTERLLDDRFSFLKISSNATIGKILVCEIFRKEILAQKHFVCGSIS
jgi:hypothetical protein